MPTDAELLAAYDDQLRGVAETHAAIRTASLGPLTLGVYRGGAGFVTYRDLGGADADGVRDLVARAVRHLAEDPEVRLIEWKTRAHDAAPGLHEALLDHGFAPQEPESIMIGAAELLALDLPLPDGVVLRRLEDPADVRAASAMADEMFGDPVSEARFDDLLGRIALGAELWAAEAEGAIVSTGRLEPVPGTSFAGIWGGATRPEWRRRGIYRALTAARARSALRLDKRWINSDSTEYSRPILERSGFSRVSATTPYEWHRGAASDG